MNHPSDICKVCQQLKVKIPKGTSPNKKRKYYADLNSKLWRGKTCPDCARKEHTAYVRNKRKAKAPRQSEA